MMLDFLSSDSSQSTNCLSLSHRPLTSALTSRLEKRHISQVLYNSQRCLHDRLMVANVVSGISTVIFKNLLWPHLP